jgi:hypothetical protein
VFALARGLAVAQAPAGNIIVIMIKNQVGQVFTSGEVLGTDELFNATTNRIESEIIEIPGLIWLKLKDMVIKEQYLYRNEWVHYLKQQKRFNELPSYAYMVGIEEKGINSYYLRIVGKEITLGESEAIKCDKIYVKYDMSHNIDCIYYFFEDKTKIYQVMDLLPKAEQANLETILKFKYPEMCQFCFCPKKRGNIFYLTRRYK